MENNIQNNIRWGQSFNLAVEMVASQINEVDADTEKTQRAILRWQRWFFEELGKRPPEVCESCGGLASITTDGIKEPIINGMHPKCRIDEGFKKQNL